MSYTNWTAIFASNKLITIIPIYKEDGENQPRFFYQKHTNTNTERLFVTAHAKNRNGDKRNEKESHLQLKMMTSKQNGMD